MNSNFLIVMFERLELYLSAGMPAHRAIHIMAEDVSKKHKALLTKVYRDIDAGGLLSVSLSKHFKISKTIQGLIGHGEASGQLANSFALAREMLEKQNDALKKTMSAMVYPFVIGIFSLLLTIGLVRGVMPQIIPMLKSLHVKLPLVTRITISVSDNLLSYGTYAIVILVIVIVVCILLYKKTIWCRILSHRIAASIPIIGRIIFLYSASLFLRSFGSLVQSGMDVQTSYANTTDAVSLLPLKREFENRLPDISRGSSPGLIISKVSKRMPKHVGALVTAGEASGTLGASLIRAAAIIDKEIDHGIKRLTSLIEPIMMIGMGSVVGSIALSIMMPIYDISKALQQ